MTQDVRIKVTTPKYRDARVVAMRHPPLTHLERRMYKALLRTEGTYVKKRWLKQRTKYHVYVLEGIKRYDPLSGDVKITFRTIVLDVPKVYDPLE